GQAWVRISTTDGWTFDPAVAVPSRVGQLNGKINYQLAAADGRHLLVAETGAHGTKLLFTHDGGINWLTSLSLPRNSAVILVGFEDPSTGRVAQGNTVWTTHTGGRTWIPYRFKYS